MRVRSRSRILGDGAETETHCIARVIHRALCRRGRVVDKKFLFPFHCEENCFEDRSSALQRRGNLHSECWYLRQRQSGRSFALYPVQAARHRRFVQDVSASRKEFGVPATDFLTTCPTESISLHGDRHVDNSTLQHYSLSRKHSYRVDNRLDRSLKRSATMLEPQEEHIDAWGITTGATPGPRAWLQ